MKTVILCGGKGTRLKEETEFKPKPMVTVGGEPILAHIMKIYQAFGHNDFLVALGYKGEMITQHFENHPEFNIQCIDTGLESLTGERVRRLAPYLRGGGRFMCTYGDGVADIDLNALLQFHEERGVIATVTGVHPRSKWGLFQIDKNNLAIGYKQKPVLGDYVNGGFMILEEAFLDYLKPDEMIETPFDRLIKKRQLAVYQHDGFWFGMDTYQDLEILNQLWVEGAPWKTKKDFLNLPHGNIRPKSGLGDRRDRVRR